MSVKFLQGHNLGAHYNKDEVAGFDAETEERLVKQKIAERYKPTAAERQAELARQAAEQEARARAEADQAAAGRLAADTANSETQPAPKAEDVK